MSTIRLNLRTDKALRSGHAPIELIFQVQGQRKYYNTGQKVYPYNWNASTQKSIRIDKKTAKVEAPGIDYDLLLTQSEADSINRKLNDISTQINDIVESFVKAKIVFTAEMVIDELKESIKPTTKKTASSKDLYDFIDQYIQDNSATRKPGSLVVYRSLKKHLESYEKFTRKKISFEKIDYAFFQSFQNYLLSLKINIDGKDLPLMNNITIAKQLSTIKTFLNYAKLHGIVVSDKYKDFKIKKESLEVIALTNDEFLKLYDADLSNDKRLSKIRDVFCFACTTGLRYSDMYQLKRENIKNDEINVTIEKTQKLLTVPLNQFSLAILAKYNNQEKPLPIISNQKMNLYLKELSKFAGIDDATEIVRYRGAIRESITYPKYELIGVHTGRKTFVSLSLERGMSAEEVMEITGHTDYKSFKRYVKVTDKRKKIVMHKAWDSQLNTNKLKAV